jgi:hypothetical protein
MTVSFLTSFIHTYSHGFAFQETWHSRQIHEEKERENAAAAMPHRLQCPGSLMQPFGGKDDIALTDAQCKQIRACMAQRK